MTRRNPFSDNLGLSCIAFFVRYRVCGAVDHCKQGASLCGVSTLSTGQLGSTPGTKETPESENLQGELQANDGCQGAGSGWQSSSPTRPAREHVAHEAPTEGVVRTGLLL